MSKAKPPKETGRDIRVLGASIVITIVHAAAVIFLLISGIIIVENYLAILIGILPTLIQKMSLDYSITIFAGCAAYLLLYMYKAEEIVKKIFNVKDVKPTN